MKINIILICMETQVKSVVGGVFGRVLRRRYCCSCNCCQFYTQNNIFISFHEQFHASDGSLTKIEFVSDMWVVNWLICNQLHLQLLLQCREFTKLSINWIYFLASGQILEQMMGKGENTNTSIYFITQTAIKTSNNCN